MLYRKILLLLAALLIIVIIVNTGQYKLWFNERIFSLSNELYDEVDSMDYGFRRQLRYGNSYQMAQIIKDRTKGMNKKNPVILTPPQSYVDKKGINVVMPEPVVLYFFAQLKGVLPTDKDAYKATMAIVIRGGQLQLIEITNRQEIDTLIAEYKKI